MKTLLMVALLLSVSILTICGCSAKEEGGDYKAPAEGEYKNAADVPERAGRERTPEGGASPSGVRSEGG